jgi:hypothetical protein
MKTTALWEVTPRGMALVTSLKTATFNKLLDGHNPRKSMVKKFSKRKSSPYIKIKLILIHTDPKIIWHLISN